MFPILDYFLDTMSALFNYVFVNMRIHDWSVYTAYIVLALVSVVIWFFKRVL